MTKGIATLGQLRHAPLLVGFIAIAYSTTPAWAQIADGSPTTSQVDSDSQLVDIVVTATKREQSLSDVGVSVTSLGGEMLENLGITDTLAITSSVPNLVNASVFGPGTNTNFSIRGVAQNDYNDGTESPIATYVDDVYYVPTGAGSFPLYDMARVEVLRGPQGTLFGRNSTGGLIHFITAKPTREFFASVGASYGSYNDRSVTAIVNLPLGEIGALRVSGRYSDNDGWIKHITGNQPKSGQLQTNSIRGQLLLEPSDTFSTLFKISYDRAAGFSSAVFHEPIGIDATTGNQFVLGNQDFYGTGPGLSPFGLGTIGSPNRADNGALRKLRGGKSFTVQNTTNWDASDSITITSVAAYNRYSRNQFEDCDGTQARLCATHYQNRSRQFTQELRAFGDMGSFRWTLGGYYLNQKSSQDVIVPLFLDISPIALGVDANLKAEGMAAFVNGEYDLSPQFTVIAGVRYSRDKKSIQQRNGFYTAANAADPFAGYEADIDPYSLFGATVAENVYTDATSNGANRFTRNGWSGKVELDFKPTDDTLLYASISRGLKSAGFNNGVITVGIPVSAIEFKPETMLAYEVGLKTSFFDRRASLNVSGFYYDYSNYQVLTFAGLGSFITNRDATLYGAEVEFNARPVPRLTLQISGGVVDTKLKGVANAGGVVADRQMPLAPSWTLSAMARYEAPLSADHSLGLQLDGNARDSFFNVPGNDSASIVPKYGVLNARIDVSDAANRYKVGVSVRNLLNDRYISSVFLLQGLGGYRYGFYTPPRWFSIDATVNFR